MPHIDFEINIPRPPTRKGGNKVINFRFLVAVKKSSSMSAVKTLPKHLKMSVTQTKPAKSSQDSWLEI